MEEGSKSVDRHERNILERYFGSPTTTVSFSSPQFSPSPYSSPLPASNETFPTPPTEALINSAAKPQISTSSFQSQNESYSPSAFSSPPPPLTPASPISPLPADINDYNASYPQTHIINIDANANSKASLVQRRLELQEKEKVEGLSESEKDRIRKGYVLVNNIYVASKL